MMLFRKAKVKVRSPDGNTDYFDIVAGVLQGDTFAPYLLIICLDYVFRTSMDEMKDSGLTAHTITNEDHVDYIALVTAAEFQKCNLNVRTF